MDEDEVITKSIIFKMMNLHKLGINTDGRMYIQQYTILYFWSCFK